MKTMFLLIFCVGTSYGQIFGGFWFDESIIVKSEYVIDSIDFVGFVPDSEVIGGYQIGDDLFGTIYGKTREHIYHDWAYEDTKIKSMQRCGVMHGKAGCPDTWFNGYRICRYCLRKEFAHENRWTEKIERQKTEVELLNEKVEKMKGVIK